MQKKLEVGIIGMGKFGQPLARTLLDNGHGVVALDRSETRVRQLQDDLPHIYAADATDIGVLQQLRFQDLDAVIVSVGGSMEASILVTLNLQEVGARRLYVKAVSNEHRKVLNRLGVDYVIQPEHDVATQLAHRLANPGMLDLLPFGGGVLLQEFTVDSWAGKTLLDLKLSNESGVMVVAIRYIGEREYTLVPSADRPLVKGDIMVVIGKVDDVARLKP
ncbi:TrkA-N domain protein [Oleidesulfovibrio alaskensis]|uniref:potassium channel family protein n=1 Tax=Oleidesulfovibrio alaskensis TaxID=58180 RepID=UPI003D2FFB64